jgi:hypothetical protein
MIRSEKIEDAKNVESNIIIQYGCDMQDEANQMKGSAENLIYNYQMNIMEGVHSFRRGPFWERYCNMYTFVCKLDKCFEQLISIFKKRSRGIGHRPCHFHPFPFQHPGFA